MYYIQNVQEKSMLTAMGIINFCSGRQIFGEFIDWSLGQEDLVIGTSDIIPEGGNSPRTWAIDKGMLGLEFGNMVV